MTTPIRSHDGATTGELDLYSGDETVIANFQRSYEARDNSALLVIDEATNKLFNLVDAAEENIETLIEDADFSDTGNVLELQQEMNKWSYMIGLASSISKALSEALKSCARNVQ